MADTSLGIATILNLVVVWALCPKVFKLYRDYTAQFKKGQDPYYDPNKLSWKGVDVALWNDINKDRIKLEKEGKPQPPFKLSKEEKAKAKAAKK